MGVAKRIVAGTVTVVLLATGAYLVADARDDLPGYLTTAPLPPLPAPFPNPPGAIAAEPAGNGPTGPDAAAPLPDQAAMDTALTKLVNDKERVGKRISVVVSDSITGDVYLSYKPDLPRIPASTMKIVAAVGAAQELDLNATLPTTIVQSSAGVITIVGHGDMMLAAGQGNAAKTDGHAGLGDLVDEVAPKLLLTGDTEIRLQLDDTFFGPHTASVWEDSTPANGWAAPVSPLAIDTGRKQAGEYAPRYADPAMQTAQTFADALAKKGITVTGNITRKAAAAGAKELGRVESAPVRDVIDYALTHSDNTITEVIGRLLAVNMDLPATFQGATTAVKTVLAAEGIDTSKVTMVDCSGLADGNEIPASVLLAVTQLLVGPQAATMRDVVVGLPIGALTGTLSGRFIGTSVAGEVRAKTGSLDGVKSLAGTVMTSQQRQLTFVVMIDKGPPAPWATRQAIDQFVTAIAQ